MEVTITQDEGHAHVAAIRVLSYRLGRPPTMEEVAEILGSKVEITNHRMRKLASLGIVHLVENPFDVHLSVADHLALEKLPAEIDEDALSDAVEDFKKRQEEKAQEMMRVFESDEEEQEKRKKHDEIADGLKSFKPKKAKKAPWEK
ncbi:MAG TPA: hypothetical protein VKU85_20700 [bacterium]|nr:hypothetical protein [bacterium]